MNREPDDRDAQIISEPLDPSELEEALLTDSEDRSFEDWDLIELAAEKWLSGHNSGLEHAAADLWRSNNPQQSVFDCDEETKALYRRLALERSTGDVQAQAERPPSMRDNFSDDEIAAAFRDQRTLDRVLDALDVANTDQDPVELIVKMVSHIEELRMRRRVGVPTIRS